jgi:large subunit ribosomal protein L21
MSETKNETKSEISAAASASNMYAVIRTGGKQYKVVVGEKLKVDTIEASVGAEIDFANILAIGNGETLLVGKPIVEGAMVVATIVAHGRHDKVHIFKMRRRKHFQKRTAHRQNYTQLFIHSISSSLGNTSQVAPAAKAQADDLVIIEGIGPKINELIVKAGITTFAQLAATSVDRLKEILKGGGNRFASHDPSTWAEQAALAAKGDWDAFKKLTDELNGGVRK